MINYKEFPGTASAVDALIVPDGMEDSISEYKTRPHTPELITKYWQRRWQIREGRIGVDILVPKCALSEEEIARLEHLPIPRKLVYVPENIDLTLLGKMHPEIDCWAFFNGDALTRRVSCHRPFKT